MAVYLSPGVFPREQNLAQNIPASRGPLRPAFVGTAKKGPLNTPILITSAQQAVDTFGEPFPESYMMYAALAYFEEGDQCYMMRVGVECVDGQDEDLSAVCIDTSGLNIEGWGRIPLFTGIDYGRINLRAISEAAPAVFHSASVSNIEYNDVEIGSNGTEATLQITGTYTGAIDDSFVVIITSAPGTSAIDGAGYQIIRNSDGEVVAEGELSDPDYNGISATISIGDGLSVKVAVTSGEIDENDTFTFTVAPNNRVFSISVNGGAATSYTMAATTYDTVDELVDAINALLSGEDYLAIEYELEDGTTIPQLRSTTAGDRIQVMSTDGWAREVGTSLYAWDIPRAYLLGVDEGPYNISSQSNRLKIRVIGTETQEIEFTIGTGSALPAENIADNIDVAGTVSGEQFFTSFALTVPGGEEHVVIIVSDDHITDTIQLVANYSNSKTLKFAEEVNIPFPYKRSYRGFSDNRVELPTPGEDDSSIPLSCEVDEGSSDCAADTAYFANIVGWLVAPSPGTWLDDYTATLDMFTEGVGEVAGRYKITIKDASAAVVEVVEDVSFDKNATRYIGNVVNPGSKFGGTDGNPYINWEPRPDYLNFDEDADDYEVREPSQFNNKEFSGMADGIPTDPALSTELDAAVIGIPSTSTGLYAFQNPETYDINLLATPGFNSGSVVGTALQICEGRGDVLYIVDPPFGLRPQQVVDWHNGILNSDLSAAINSSYGALYWSWVEVLDTFNSNLIWIPPSGHVLAVYSRTARDSEQWFAPAGLRRGGLLTVRDLEYTPSTGERDLLYGSGNAVNPIVKFPQDGIKIWGQRTLDRTDSPTNRANVRMLMTYLKKNLIRLLRNFVFEPNDTFAWKQVQAVIEPFLADVQSRRGLQAFKVIVDSTNNTAQRISNNELHVSVIVVPTFTIEFVVLNLVINRSTASFGAEEVLASVT